MVLSGGLVPPLEDGLSGDPHKRSVEEDSFTMIRIDVRNCGASVGLYLTT